jgi:DNA polymerase-3 subunit gamma/tau
MLSTAAFNALLKTLEEPPAHAIFVLATTEVHRVPATVLSRCQRHEFRRLPTRTIVEYLDRKAAEAGVRADPGALELIGRHATGSLRDAISLLDQLSALEPPVTAEHVRAVLGRASDSAVWELVAAWADGDAARGLRSIQAALEGGADARPFARQVVEALRDVLLVQIGNQALPERSAEEADLLSRLSSKASRSGLLAALRSFGRAASEGRASWQPALALELALLESLAGAGLPAPSGPAPRTDAGLSTGPAATGTSRRSAPAPAKPRAEGKPAVHETRASLPAIQEIIERWPEVLKAAFSRDPKTQALLNSCRPLGIESGVLLLGFQSDLLREKMERSPSLSVAGEALQQVFETSLRVRCVITSRWQEGHSAPQESPSLDEAGMVATAVRDFGAHVVGIEPLPPESPA